MPSPQLQVIIREAREWIVMAKQMLSSHDETSADSYCISRSCQQPLTPSQALAIVSHYDLIHRIAYRTPAPVGILNTHTLRAFEALVHGDTSIDSVVLFPLIQAGIDRRDPAYLDRPLRWLSHTLARWHRQAKATLPAMSYGSGKPSDSSSANNLKTHPQAINTRIIPLLLSADLYPFEGSGAPAFKSLLASTYSYRN